MSVKARECRARRGEGGVARDVGRVMASAYHGTPGIPALVLRWGVRSSVLVVVVAGLVALGLGAIGLWVYGGRGPAVGGVSGGVPRVVVLSPAAAVIVADLGMSSVVVGRHGYDMVLPETVPVCGDQAGIDYETLLRVRPTLVVTELGAGPPARLVEMGRRHGWKVENVRLLTLSDIDRGTEWLGRELGAGAGVVESLRGRMASAWARREGLAGLGRVLLLESLDPPAGLGPGSCHHEVLERLGARPAIGTGLPYVTLDAEDLLRMGPEVIVWIRPRERGAASSEWAEDAGAVRSRLGRVGRLDLPAFRSGRVALIDDPLSLMPSTSMIGFSERLGALLGRWAAESRK